MRVLGEILVNLQSYDVFFVLEIDNGSSPAFVRFCDSEYKLPVWRFVSDDVLRFKDVTRQLQIRTSANAGIVLTTIVGITRHTRLKAQLLLS